MAGGRNGILGNQYFVADGAVLALCQSSFGTGGSYCLVADFRMAGGSHIEIYIGVPTGSAGMGSVAPIGAGGSRDGGFIAVACRNDFLGNQNFVTDRAVLALCQTGFRTIGSYCLVNCFGVTSGIYIGIHIAVTTGRANMGGVPLLGAGWISDSGFIAVACRNDLLCNQNIVADGAVLAFRQAGFGTGGGCCLVGHFRVAGSGNNNLGSKHFAAGRAMFALCKAGFRAGGVNCLVNCFGVSSGIYIGIRKGVTTDGAGVGGVALLRAGGSCNNTRINMDSSIF